MTRTNRIILQGGIGLAIGAVLMWLALRSVSLSEVSTLLGQTDARWVAIALAFYGCDLCLRICRWHLLLSTLKPVRLLQVGEILLVGYAVNNTLPARLGELFRAHYAKQRIGITRSASLGTIIVERLLDGVTVVVLLITGLLLSESTMVSSDDGSRRQLLENIAIIGTVAMMLAGITIAAAVRFGPSLHSLVPSLLARRLGDAVSGLASLRRDVLARVLLLNLAIWFFETMALWGVVRATGVGLDVVHLLVLVGAASLSTLVPTAPGYLGSYQLVFATCFAAFGLPMATGIVAATLVQLSLLSTVTVSGLLLYSLRSSHQLVRK